MPIALRFAARSNLGLGSKTRNEDSAYASPDMLVLADGMGGHAAGDTASATVVAEVMQLDGESWAADEAAQQLRAAVIRANDRLRAEMEAHAETEGMGTTLVAFLLSGNKLAMANIGDSRAYLVRDGVFSQLTKDHSFVQALLDEGRITQDEAEHHPQRSMVTRVLTGREDDEPDISLREARTGDRYLICSDGLSDYVAGSTIEGIVTSQGSPGDIADRLIEIALKASTRDNVTVVVADVVDGNDPISTTPQIVGAAADRQMGRSEDDTQEQPQQPRTPAEKAAALQRETAPTPPPHQGPPVQHAPGEDYVDDGDTQGMPQLAEEKPRRGRWRWFALGAVLLAMLAAAGLLGYNWTQQQYYVGADKGKVAIFKGVPQKLGPISLSSVDSTTDMAVSTLPSYYRSRVNATMTAKSKSDASRIVENVRAELRKCQVDTSGSNCAP
ncbi:PP2C family serine/threonine-protein phosphatase [Yimella sp. cx-51]|uniref:PP2C family protein-serine/threonine phosphatase n=1 Tax=Yimella sp. cx-51 TaxID=2770551 RepID=UPI00165E2ECC|nr:protein phosphatase 2C domain-containing protein [Yimella sp. cx-51]MBC9958045.1 serine/threonine-protein phosphatase [Yimella sp. cx-51]MBD2760595.1 serine/threonine-protein phosphatase [Yimella sp. cx-573]QTH38163.1 serine/threonine-protein phosphatase [Yimella sp. cx-51]